MKKQIGFLMLTLTPATCLAVQIQTGQNGISEIPPLPLSIPAYENPNFAGLEMATEGNLAGSLTASYPMAPMVPTVKLTPAASMTTPDFRKPTAVAALSVAARLSDSTSSTSRQSAESMSSQLTAMFEGIRTNWKTGFKKAFNLTPEQENQLNKKVDSDVSLALHTFQEIAKQQPDNQVVNGLVRTYLTHPSTAFGGSMALAHPGQARVSLIDSKTGKMRVISLQRSDIKDIKSVHNHVAGDQLIVQYGKGRPSVIASRPLPMISTVKGYLAEETEMPSDPVFTAVAMALFPLTILVIVAISAMAIGVGIRDSVRSKFWASRTQEAADGLNSVIR